eukprot:TRINITY_DN19187_c0_g2_i1.p2 TRINITY_DN19187_c0_g2~~TRINITY_DN19187_c0_g2_i1.p2  ORF type:complete len:146 (-),score=30.36 TRINITY_DN19187_c0_g2_i1:54-491(-)
MQIGEPQGEKDGAAAMEKPSSPFTMSHHCGPKAVIDSERERDEEMEGEESERTSNKLFHSDRTRTGEGPENTEVFGKLEDVPDGASESSANRVLTTEADGEMRPLPKGKGGTLEGEPQGLGVKRKGSSSALSASLSSTSSSGEVW